MTENGQGYVQVVRGPDGEPIAMIRLSDLVELLARARPAGERQATDDKPDLPRIGVGPKMHVDQVLFTDTAAGNAELSEFAKHIRKAMKDVFEAPNFERVLIMPHCEDTADLAAAREVQDALARGEERLIPSAIADRLIDGESPLRVWRNARRLTQAVLAKKAGISQAMISGIERGARTGDVQTLKRLAEALDLKVDDLID